jgi:ElaB/YqjD/DUF883 family membrane-anchored ribosome-binding protein
VSDDRDPQEIRRQIEATRTELGDTVAALAVKTDLKAQLHHRVEEGRQKALARRDELLGKARETSPEAVRASATLVERIRANPLPAAVAGAALAGLLLGRLTSR